MAPEQDAPSAGGIIAVIIVIVILMVIFFIFVFTPSSFSWLLTSLLSLFYIHHCTHAVCLIYDFDLRIWDGLSVVKRIFMWMRRSHLHPLNDLDLEHLDPNIYNVRAARFSSIKLSKVSYTQIWCPERPGRINDHNDGKCDPSIGWKCCTNSGIGHPIRR